MKVLISIMFALLFFLQNGIGQTAPRIKEVVKYYKHSTDPDYTKFHEEYYDYDHLGNLTSIETKEFYEFPNISAEIWEGEFFEYNNDQLLSKKSQKRYNLDVDLWVTNSWIEYDYDLNGCLVEESYIQNVGDPFESNKVFYKRNEKCQELSRHEEKYFLGQNDTVFIQDFYDRIYLDDGISYEEYKFHSSSSVDSNYLDSSYVFIFNDRNQVIEYEGINWNSNGSTPFKSRGRKELFKYDEFQNIEERQILKRDFFTPEWEPFEVYFFTNEYDENGFLIKTKKELYLNATNSIANNFTENITFKNSCKNILEEEITFLGNSNNAFRNEYYYEGIDECIDAENLYLNIKTYPNPSNGFLKIYSPIFQTGNTDILIYSIDGKLLLEKNEIDRSPYSSMDLSELNNGIYILQLRSGNLFVKSKIVIAK